jgi:hypothetical protein
MRFRLRTLLVVFLLLCVSAPWWPDVYHGMKRWMSPPPTLKSSMALEELTQLCSELRDGMTISEADGVFGHNSKVFPGGSGRYQQQSGPSVFASAVRINKSSIGACLNSDDSTEAT